MSLYSIAVGFRIHDVNLTIAIRIKSVYDLAICVAFFRRVETISRNRFPYIFFENYRHAFLVTMKHSEEDAEEENPNEFFTIVEAQSPVKSVSRQSKIA